MGHIVRLPNFRKLFGISRIVSLLREFNDLVRYHCLHGHWKTLAPVTVEWYILAINAIFYLIVSYFLLKIVEKQVKKQGLHLI